jgi:predicted GNAT superfamily acetyltransferase
MLLRDANPSDFPQILKLNEASVHFLSPLTPVRLEHLHKEAAYHRVLETGGNVAAFLLAFREGCTYDSPNYRWFAENYDRFLYIDRIVVSVAYRGRGIGHRFYTDLFSFARQTNASRVTCEFDIDPPNDLSRRFHERYGFKEVGTQSVASGKKQVSLQALSLEIERTATDNPASAAHVKR